MVTSFPAGAANDTMTTGAVKSFDLAADVLVLDIGINYALPATLKGPGLKIGEKVGVGWVMDGKVYQAGTVPIAK